jgi:hypothetical protein
MKNACPKKIESMTGVGFSTFYEACFYHTKYSVSQCFLTVKFQNQKTSQGIFVNSWQSGDENATI